MARGAGTVLDDMGSSNRCRWADGLEAHSSRRKLVVKLTLGILVALVLASPPLAGAQGVYVGKHPYDLWRVVGTDDPIRVCAQQRLTARPIPEVEVRVDGGPLQRAGPDGCAAIALGEAEKVAIEVSHPDHESVRIRATRERREGLGRELVVPLHSLRAVTVEGRVVDGSNRPVAGAKISLLTGEGEVSLLTTRSGPQGEYAITTVPPGTYRLRVTHPRYTPWEQPSAAVEADEAPRFDVRLEPLPTTATVEGRVVDGATRRSLRNVRVSVPGAGVAFTDELGRYRLEGVPGGFVDVRLEAEGYPTAVRGLPVIVDRRFLRGAPSSADFELSRHRGRLLPVTRRLEAGESGEVRAPGSRWLLSFPAESVRAESLVTLREAAEPLSQPGDRLPLPSDLDRGDATIVALGPELELRIEPVTGESPDDGWPIAGIVAVTAFYGAAEAERLGVAEQAIAIWRHDGSTWRPVPPLPFIHAVDRLNKLLLTAIPVPFVDDETADSFDESIRVRLAGPRAAR